MLLKAWQQECENDATVSKGVEVKPQMKIMLINVFRFAQYIWLGDLGQKPCFPPKKAFSKNTLILVNDKHGLNLHSSHKLAQLKKKEERKN